MKKLSLILAILIFTSSLLYSQVAINSDGSAPDASAGLDVSFTNKGFLMPRMTQSQIEAIPNLTNGLVVFCTTDNKFYVYVENASAWKEILYGSGIITPSCGFSITINHLVLGGVAPVDKTVTYGTVTNVPGEPTKCWITSNLGAYHQATAKDDSTEASAGWYWQFNRMQGYKHDDSTVTPAWMITVINENSDWITANDPCALELGSGWHIPTYTEWNNVDVSGGWNDWNGPWNSALKLHAAGFLYDNDGSLGYRGSYCYYWSSSQSASDGGWNLFLGNTACLMSSNLKAGGVTVRCLRD